MHVEMEERYERFWRTTRDELRGIGFHADWHPEGWSGDHLILPNRHGVDHYRLVVKPLMSWVDYELEMDDVAEKRRHFAHLWDQRHLISKAYGGDLVLQPKHGPQVGVLETEPIPKGIDSPPHEWIGLRSQLIDHLCRLQDALGAHIADWGEHAELY